MCCTLCIRRCHSDVKGGRNACCQNVHPPDKLKNTHNFHKKIVAKAASLMNRWWEDEELGMCRVVKFGGSNVKTGKMEPVLFYTHVIPETGVIEEEWSSLPEVMSWVKECDTNM